MFRLIPPVRGAAPCGALGSAGLALPIALCSAALLLFTSLSIQTLCLHRRQRFGGEMLRLQLQDRLNAAAMDFQQRARHLQRCLLEQPSSAWGVAQACPSVAVESLQAGLSGNDAWRLIRWTPLSPHRGELVVALADGGAHTLQLELAR